MSIINKSVNFYNNYVSINLGTRLTIEFMSFIMAFILSDYICRVFEIPSIEIEILIFLPITLIIDLIFAKICFKIMHKK